MVRKPPGIFITGTDTEVGKTYVGCQIAENLRRQDCDVGVYKPAASGCVWHDGRWVSEDGLALWHAAGQPESVQAVCPQTFRRPIAPHLAAIEEGQRIDVDLLVRGLQFWAGRQFLIVEGAGGLLSPIGDKMLNVDLALEFGFPLLIVVANRVGAVNQALQTWKAAQSYAGQGIRICGMILNDHRPVLDDSAELNLRELRKFLDIPVLLRLRHHAPGDWPDIDWMALATQMN